MKKKLIFFLLLFSVVGIVVGGYFCIKDRTDKKTNDISIANENNSANKNNNDVIENDVETESELDKKYPVEKDFLTTIKGGSSDEEVIKNNLLLKNSSVPVDERIEAKRVAENFVQSLASYDEKDNKQFMNIALNNSSTDLKNIINSYFTDASVDKLKKIEITKLRTEERINDEENEYLYFKVIVSRDMIDNHGQKTKAQPEKDIVKLLKIDGEYKVVNFRADE